MSNTLYTYYDTDFSLNQTGNCTFLLLISGSSFSAAVVNANRVMVWIKHCPIEELLSPVELSGLFNAVYAQVIAGVEASKFTLWPQALFEPRQTAAIARLLNTDSTDTIITNRLDQQNAVIYLAPQTVADSIKKYHWEQQTTFGLKGYINAITSNSPSEQSLYINVNSGQIDILYLEDNQVRFCNSFHYNNADELVYYTVLAAQELKLDLTITYIKASGDLMAGDPYMSRLAEFFKGAELNSLRLIDLPAVIPSYQILALSALTLCASLAEA